MRSFLYVKELLATFEKSDLALGFIGAGQEAEALVHNAITNGAKNIYVTGHSPSFYPFANRLSLFSRYHEPVINPCVSRSIVESYIEYSRRVVKN